MKSITTLVECFTGHNRGLQDYKGGRWPYPNNTLQNSAIQMEVSFMVGGES